MTGRLSSRRPATNPGACLAAPCPRLRQGARGRPVHPGGRRLQPDPASQYSPGMISRRQTCPSRAPDHPIQPQHLPPRLPQTAAERDPRRHPGLFPQPEASTPRPLRGEPIVTWRQAAQLAEQLLRADETTRRQCHQCNSVTGNESSRWSSSPCRLRPRAVPRSRNPRLISPAHPHRHRRIQAARPPNSEVLGGVRQQCAII